jgi:PII-like signaling protein
LANQKEGLQLCVFLLETMYYNHKPLYEVIVEMAHGEGLAGAIVYRGIESYGMDHLLHTNRLVDLSVDLPVMVEIVDTPQTIRRFLPLLDQVIALGVATLSPVQIVKCSARERAWSC